MSPDLPNIPKTVAIIMDGNRRWAKLSGASTASGHLQGVKALEGAAKFAKERGVQNLIVYAFSTENWQRASDEISGLLTILNKYLDKTLKEAKSGKSADRIVFFGNFDVFSASIKSKVEAINAASQEGENKDGSAFTLYVALNYSFQQDVIHAFSSILTSAIKTRKPYEDVLKEITLKTIENNFYLKEVSKVDLLIRTGGECRISNFLLWQCAYAELYFTSTLWPDFKEEHFNNAILEFSKRERRYGQ